MKNLSTASDPDCALVRTRLSARHDGEGRADDTGVSAHLAGCPACSAFERELATLTKLFEPLRRVEPPPGLFAGIAVRAARGEGRRRPYPVRAWVLRVAAGFIGFLAVFTLARMRSGTGRESPVAPGARGQDPLELFARTTRALHDGQVGALPERELLLQLAARTETGR